MSNRKVMLARTGAALVLCTMAAPAHAQSFCVPPGLALPGEAFPTPWDDPATLPSNYCRQGIDVRPWRNALVLSNTFGQLIVRAVVHADQLMIMAEQKGGNAIGATTGDHRLGELNVVIGPSSGPLRIYRVQLGASSDGTNCSRGCPGSC